MRPWTLAHHGGRLINALTPCIPERSLALVQSSIEWVYQTFANVTDTEYGPGFSGPMSSERLPLSPRSQTVNFFTGIGCVPLIRIFTVHVPAGRAATVTTVKATTGSVPHDGYAPARSPSVSAVLAPLCWPCDEGELHWQRRPQKRRSQGQLPLLGHGLASKPVVHQRTAVSGAT